MKPKYRDIAGQTFDRLTAIKHLGGGYWLTKCICGNEKRIISWSLTSGKTRSCGCLHQEIRRAWKRTHGMSETRQYRIWFGIKRRCSDKNDKNYYLYGGRGIKMCDRWINSFENFWKDMSVGYADNLTIDRTDVNGNYEQGNCRWVEQWEQNNNQRSNIRITIDGKTLNAKQWSIEVGLNYGTLISRIHLLHWDPVIAVTTPKSNKWDHSKRR